MRRSLALAKGSLPTPPPTSLTSSEHFAMGRLNGEAPHRRISTRFRYSGCAAYGISSTDTVLALKLEVRMSGLPSPFTSASTTDVGPTPTAYLV